MPATEPIQHPGEERSNDVRRRTAITEPKALRTFTRSQAVLAKSAGAYHWTPEGRRLADFSSGVLVANLGHNPVRWWRRVRDLMGLGAILGDEPLAEEYSPAVTLTAYNSVTELEIEANERLLASLQSQPGGGRLEQVLWAASGSEAVQKALWAAMKRRPGQQMILATRHGFHGKKGLAGAVTGSEQDSERDPRVRFIGFPMAECDTLERRRQPLDLAPFEAELRRIGDELRGKLCCLITEPYLGGGGSYHPQPEYMQLLERFCREQDILFILDEIQANFGRTGPMYAYTQYGVEPDIVCLGKGLGNGVPVSAAVGPSDVFGALKYGEGSDTWSANPLAAAAVIATLDEFEQHDVIGQGRRLAEVIEAGLIALLDTGAVAKIRGEGCVWGVECQGSGDRDAVEIANACVEACYRGDDEGRGIHLLGPLAGKVIRVSPPLTMNPAECREHLDVMRRLFAEVAQG